MNVTRLKFEPIDLSEVEFTEELVRSIAAETVQKYHAVPVFCAPGHLCVALTETAGMKDMVYGLTRTLNENLVIRVADKQQLDKIIQRFYGSGRK